MRYRNYGFYFSAPVQQKFKNRYRLSMDTERETFTNGVFMANMDSWREKQAALNKEVAYWMKENSKHHYWKLGSNPLAELVFYRDWENKAPYEWQLEHLEEPNIFTVDEVASAKLLHFTTKDKPWKVKHQFGMFWERQQPERCS